MSGDERAQFLYWYEKQKDKILRNKEELLAYCMDDINVLKQACCAFRNLFLKQVKIDPFCEAMTISSICNKVFLTIFLKPNTAGIIPRGGYRTGDLQSIEPLQWFAYIGQTRSNVTHDGNGREVHLSALHNLKVDGYCAETNEVFKYPGLFGTGVYVCPIDTSLLAKQMKETIFRLQRIKDASYKVVSICGCEFRKLLVNNPGLENELC